MFRKIVKFLSLVFVIVLIDIFIISFSNQVYCKECLGSPGFLKFLKWKFSRDKPNNWPELPKKNTTPNKMLDNVEASNEISITYINHSSLLIQTANVNVITDPIWSLKAGPFGMFGPKRHSYPGVNFNDLPRIDVILISHSHYDHLDNKSINMLTNDHDPILITGLGVSRYIDYCKKEKNKCVELGWWEKKSFQQLNFNYVPAYHWSSRYLIDKNTSLWGGFVIQTPNNNNVYFAGDTGYGNGEYFKQIKEKFGNIDISILPIGAYKPQWFFSSMHTSPAEAVEISNILDSSFSIPIHYDIFMLTDDKYNEPLHDLQKAIKECSSCKSDFKILDLGGTFIYKQN